MSYIESFAAGVTDYENNGLYEPKGDKLAYIKGWYFAAMGR